MTPEPAVPSGSAGSGVSASAPGPLGDGSPDGFGADWPSRQGVDPRIRYGFTTRAGGRSRPPYNGLNLGGAVGDDPATVAANRARLAQAAGLTAAQVTWMRQVHGSTVTLVDSAGRPSSVGQPPGNLPDCDGIVTAATGLGLAVLVADCVPILAGDPVAGVIGAVHAGRRGAADGIALRALNRMAAAGAATDNITVLLGPSICGRCYEVPAVMQDEVEAALPGSASATDRGTPGLDLRAGLTRQLRAAGVLNVVVDPRCTYTDSRFFSHRAGAPTGRFAGLIWMPSRS